MLLHVCSMYYGMLLRFQRSAINNIDICQTLIQTMADLEIDFKFFVEGIFLVRFRYEIYISILFVMFRFWSGSEASLVISSALFGSTRR